MWEMLNTNKYPKWSDMDHSLVFCEIKLIRIQLTFNWPKHIKNKSWLNNDIDVKYLSLLITSMGTFHEAAMHWLAAAVLGSNKSVCASLTLSSMAWENANKTKTYNINYYSTSFFHYLWSHTFIGKLSLQHHASPSISTGAYVSHC